MKYKILLLSLVIPILLSAQTRRLWVDSLFVRGSAGDYRKVNLAETFGDTSLTGLDSVGVYDAVNNWYENGYLRGASITDNSITSAKIVDNSITSAKIVDNSITSAKIAASGIYDLKLNQITTANKVAGSAVQLSSENSLRNSNGLGIRYNTNTFEMSGGLNIKNSSINWNWLSTSVKDSIRAHSVGTVNITNSPDDLTIEEVSNNIQLKDAGIIEKKLSSDAIAYANVSAFPFAKTNTQEHINTMRNIVSDVTMYGTYDNTKYYHISDIVRDLTTPEWRITISRANSYDDTTLTDVCEFSTTISPEKGKKVTTHYLDEISNSGITARVALNWENVSISSEYDSLELWLEADEGIVENEYGKVAVWYDLSPNGNHVWQGDTTYQPDYKDVADTNFVDFGDTGDDAYMKSPLYPSNRQTIEFYAHIYKAAQSIAIGSTYNTRAYFGTNLYVAGGVGDSTWANILGTTSLTVDSSYYFAITFDSDSVKLYLDGVLEDSSPRSGNVPLWTYYIGGLHVSGGYLYSFKGGIYGMKVWNSIRSTAQMSAQQAVWEAKYGN